MIDVPCPRCLLLVGVLNLLMGGQLAVTLGQALPVSGVLAAHLVRGLRIDSLESARTTNAIEGLHEKFERRIKTQAVQWSSAEVAATLFWALLDLGQIVMRKVDGPSTLAELPFRQYIDCAV